MHIGVRLASSFLLALAVAPPLARAQSADPQAGLELIDPKVLRVCADPGSLPASNQALEGFENKIADLFAAKLGKSVAYTWFPQVTGFVRRTLGERRCDVIMGYPQGDELVTTTNPYYRTTYALVFKPGGDLDGVDTLEDARLKGRKIGIVAGTPPATNLAVNGLLGNIKSYALAVDTRYESPPRAMIEDVRAGVIDVGIVWGPIAGYYAIHGDPKLTVVPLVKETKGPREVYHISMGVRGSDQNWKRVLNKLIAENQPAINAILLDYGVPLLDEHDAPITH
jgi:quinoprotein dehydrogenase-associated probable ABC transporter substrate-binding protein